jgi:hypothetical protein
LKAVVCDWSRSITILWYNLQLVEGGQYVIEVEVLQSSDIDHLQQAEDYIRGL